MKAVGHSFASPNILPKISIDGSSRRVTFPACFIGDSIFQTVKIENHSHTPEFFTIVNNELSKGEVRDLDRKHNAMQEHSCACPHAA